MLWVRGRKHVLSVAEGRFWRPRSTASWMSAARYVGVRPDHDWCTRQAILNSIRRRTGSQCSCCSTGVMWSRLLALVSCPRCEQSWWLVKTVANSNFRTCFIQRWNVVRTTGNDLDLSLLPFKPPTWQNSLALSLSVRWTGHYVRRDDRFADR